MTTTTSQPSPLTFKKSDCYMTPEKVMAPIRAVAPIAFDPFAGEVANLGAHNWRPGMGNSLEADWSEQMLIGARKVAGALGPVPVQAFCNPSYSATWLSKSLAKISVEAKAWRSAGLNHCMTALIPASTGAKWFEPYVWQSAQAGCFLKGRISFLNPDTGEPDPAGSGRFWSFVGFWGVDPDPFFEAFADHGELARLNV